MTNTSSPVAASRRHPLAVHSRRAGSPDRGFRLAGAGLGCRRRWPALPLFAVREALWLSPVGRVMLACAGRGDGEEPAVRVVVLGGTGFIGRRVVEQLVSRGDDVLVVHRGVTEPPGWVDCRHLHAARTAFAEVSGEVRRFAPDAVLDSHALTAADVAAVLPCLPDAALVALSSMDVYRAYEHFRARREGEPVPLDEDAAVRVGRYPYRGEEIGEDDYEKLDVEPPYLARGGTVLRRVRAGRRRIPVGAGTLLLTRLYVHDAASAVLAALDNPAAAAGEVFN